MLHTDIEVRGKDEGTARRQIGACPGIIGFQNGWTMKSQKAGQHHRKAGAQTLAIHSGEPKRHGVNTGVGTSICRSSTFTFSSTQEMKEWAEGKNTAYIYTRYGNPTLSVAEGKIAALEGAEAAVVTASGMAAISSALLSST